MKRSGRWRSTGLMEATALALAAASSSTDCGVGLPTFVFSRRWRKEPEVNECSVEGAGA